MYKVNKAGRCILAAFLAVVMAVPLLTGGAHKDMSKVQAAATLNNPRKGSNGVVTWDLVYFGRYPQSDASGKKSDPIKWRVLSVNGNDATGSANQQKLYAPVFGSPAWFVPVCSIPETLYYFQPYAVCAYEGKKRGSGTV